MTDNPRQAPPARAPGDDPARTALDRIAALLGRDDELHLGMAVFDLWAAFDALVDPMAPPPPPRPVWVEDAAQALRETHADLVVAIDGASTTGEALQLGHAARNVANALATLKQGR